MLENNIMVNHTCVWNKPVLGQWEAGIINVAGRMERVRCRTEVAGRKA